MSLLISAELFLSSLLTIFRRYKNFNLTNYHGSLQLSVESVLAFWNMGKSENKADREKLFCFGSISNCLEATLGL